MLLAVFPASPSLAWTGTAFPLISETSITSCSCFYASQAPESSLQPKSSRFGWQQQAKKLGLLSASSCGTGWTLAGSQYKFLWLLENRLETSSSRLLARNLKLLVSSQVEVWYIYIYIFKKVTSSWSLGIPSSFPRRPDLSITDLLLCSKPPKVLKDSCERDRRWLISFYWSSLAAWRQCFPGLHFFQSALCMAAC